MAASGGVRADPRVEPAAGAIGGAGGLVGVVVLLLVFMAKSVISITVRWSLVDRLQAKVGANRQGRPAPAGAPEPDRHDRRHGVVGVAQGFAKRRLVPDLQREGANEDPRTGDAAHPRDRNDG